ncbi:MAG: hypothetical protein ACM3H7_03555 [Acidobacteriaceae bacterium]
MPNREKFQHVFEMVRLYLKHVLPFVESHLGYSEMHNLRSVWQAAIIPIHEYDSDQDKYDQAYSNWLWMARCSHDTLADLLSSPEVLEYKRMLLRLYEQQLDNPNLAILRLFRAHTNLAKALLYDMQWLTPIELTSSSKTEVTCVVRQCKIRRIAGTDRVCRVDCQNVGREYAHRVYHLKRVTIQSDEGCSISLTPLSTQSE